MDAGEQDPQITRQPSDEGAMVVEVATDDVKHGELRVADLREELLVHLRAVDLRTTHSVGWAG